ncbi:MAG: endolytic transglycosylase MltG [Chloroflexi bacterium]|nr:endolytic transglycosylase MltG [Chloroflexota bacterium]
MRVFIRPLLLFVGGLLVMGLLCGGLLFSISGQQPVTYVQAQLSRFTLFTRTDDLNRTVSDDAGNVGFVIEPGDFPAVIAQNLFDSALITDPELFVDYVSVYGLDVHLEAGEYCLNPAQTIPEIAEALTDARKRQFPFRILAGWRLEEIADIIDRTTFFDDTFSGDAFLAAAGVPVDNAEADPTLPALGSGIDPTFAAWVELPEGQSLEGFMLPAIHPLCPDITPEELVEILTKRFREVIEPLLPDDPELPSVYEIVTLASIIQREAIHTDEYPMIASVYLNRIDIGMKLDADPTVQYSLGTEGNWWPQITQADYANTELAYNTYRPDVPVPPGPIANPSRLAIEAVLAPESTNFLYFRVECGGSGYHVFARTFAEHLANACE